VEMNKTMGLKFFTENPGAIKSWALKHEAVEVFWWPLNSAHLTDRKLSRWDPRNDHAYVRLFDKIAHDTTEPELNWATTIKNSIHDWTDSAEIVLGKIGTGIANGIDHLFFNKIYAAVAMDALSEGIKTASRSGAIHYQKHIDDWKVNDVELCFKLDENWTNLPRLVNVVIDITTKWIKIDKKPNPLNIAMEFRISKQSNTLMSPAFSNEDSYFLWLEVLGTQKYPNWWEDYVIQILNGWLKVDPNGKPHWCKWNVNQVEWKKTIKRNYAHQIEIFSQYVRSSDPQGIFRTDFWNDMLNLEQ